MGPTSPLLAVTPTMTPFDRTRWVLQCPSGHQLLLNAAGADLLTLLTAAPSLLQGCATFNERYAAALTPTEFEHLIHQRFGGYRLLAGESAALRPPVNHHIQLRYQVLSPRWAGRLAAPLTGLYAPRVFWPLLAVLTLVLGLLCWAGTASSHLPTGWALVALFYGSMLVHELGHIAACRRVGLAHGGIGVGFYLLVPVLYADVTAIWQAPRQQRIIANLGGIYSQLLYAALVAAAGLALHAPAWLLTAQAVAWAAAWQLNPFVRHDGYWLIADFTNTPNLMQKARRVQQALLSRSFLAALRSGRPAVALGPRWGWLLVYGTFNTAVLVAFLGVLLHSAGPVILHLPHVLSGLLHKALNGTLEKQDITSKILTALAFYGILFRMLIIPYIVKGVGFLRKSTPPPVSFAREPQI